MSHLLDRWTTTPRALLRSVVGGVVGEGARTTSTRPAGPFKLFDDDESDRELLGAEDGEGWGDKEGQGPLLARTLRGRTKAKVYGAVLVGAGLIVGLVAWVFVTGPRTYSRRTGTLLSDKRGHVALVYSGTARSFSDNFESAIVNLMAGCPYTVHLFFHTYSNDNRWPSGAVDSKYANYQSVNATLAYYRGYVNLDGQEVLFSDAVKGNVLEELDVGDLPKMYPEYEGVREKYNNLSDGIPVDSYYYMWRSGEQAELLRQSYMAAAGIDYKWVFRMRHDAAYHSNWWDKAFDITVYSPSHSSGISHDVTSDWGVAPTRLYDLVYSPRLSPDNALYTPFGWSYGGINDQFAAMSSKVAFDYFTRIRHLEEMIAEGYKIHAETSIRWVAEHYHLRNETRTGNVCWDVVRAVPTGEKGENGKPKIHCERKWSGVDDCLAVCPDYEGRNMKRVWRIVEGVTGNGAGGSALRLPPLEEYLSWINGFFPSSERVSTWSSSYFYYYIARERDRIKCRANDWRRDMGNQFLEVDLPFVLRSEDEEVGERYRQLLTCTGR
ncbi:hypothetical protein MNV49_003947 [Pseudohyphozyma bogoriensis]|nr:hypothetical protein MNV49_003947 [Pseudohyphozyma bogoriensis]